MKLVVENGSPPCTEVTVSGSDAITSARLNQDGVTTRTQLTDSGGHEPYPVLIVPAHKAHWSGAASRSGGISAPYALKLAG